ncbi:mesoderm posterior aa [Mugil cephalus]|uniref:mesoderm posterior aa n=1 Tax=Mugil cephalus TaxID=48193 RepID=UPI001FB8437A|nr:mesoderm posterior aa [Mugil cephalus]
MESSYSTSLQLQDNSFLFDCESLLDKSLAYDPASDPGYFSAASSLSPTSSVDSFCFSPTSFQAMSNEQDALDCFIFSKPVAHRPTHQAQTPLCPAPTSSASTSATKKSRSRYPGKKRQTASEREKLRMRDLTKALNHVRTYLPPSVVPAGQSLTKIETLRLTIRYISYLSAQLGLSDEALEQRRSSSAVEQTQPLSQFLAQPTASYGTQESRCTSVSTAQVPSYQVSSGFAFNSEQYWMLQQQCQDFTFSGQC